MRLRLVCFILLFSGSHAYGQEIPTGAKIRVQQRTVSSNPDFQNRTYRVNGLFMARTADSLYLTVDSMPRVMPMSQVARLDYVSGTRPATWKGMRTGALIGGAALGLAAAASEANCSGWCFGMGFALGVGALAGGVPGGAIGALIGSTMRTDRWQQVPLPDR